MQESNEREKRIPRRKEFQQEGRSKQEKKKEFLFGKTEERILITINIRKTLSTVYIWKTQPVQQSQLLMSWLSCSSLTSRTSYGKSPPKNKSSLMFSSPKTKIKSKHFSEGRAACFTKIKYAWLAKLLDDLTTVFNHRQLQTSYSDGHSREGEREGETLLM